MNMYIYMGIRMASKNISIKKETYDKLVSLKKETESFTDIIEHLLQESNKIGQSLGRFFGIWKDDPILTIEMITADREELNAQLLQRFS